MTSFPKICLCTILTCLLASCATPEKALEKKNYLIAMNLASKSISKGKDVKQNEQYLQTAAEGLVKETLEKYQAQNSTKLSDWKKSQTRFNTVLHQVGEKNIKTDGLVSKSYDRLCEVKHELDLRIVDYYFDEGERLLTKSITLNESKWARMAHEQYLLSEKEGAEHFYSNLGSRIEECIVHGSILIDAPSNLSLNNIFLKPISNGEEAIADCTINIQEGLTNFSKSESKSTETKTKEIVVGQNAVTDTSGVTTYEDILEEIEGYKNINNITYTVTQDLNIYVTPNNSECFLTTRYVDLTVSDECTEVEYTGDTRVFTSTIEESCNNFSIKWALEREIADELNQNLYIY